MTDGDTAPADRFRGGDGGGGRDVDGGTVVLRTEPLTKELLLAATEKLGLGDNGG